MRIFLLLFLLLESFLGASMLRDHYGRELELPQKVSKIFVASPSLMLGLVAFDPSLVCGINTPFTQEQKPYVGAAFEQSVVGGLMGGGANLNFEKIAMLKPDVVLVWGRMSGVDKIIKQFENIGLKVFLVKNDSMRDLVGQFELFGRLSGNTKRAKQLIAYTEETLRLLERYKSALQNTKPKRYYFAEGIDGLSSECDGSFHLEPFLYAGGENALECKMSSNYGMEKISPEQVLLGDPDVIFAMEEQFFKNIKQNPHFKRVRALKEGRVYLVPNAPFNYISRPPSFMRLMGVRWVMNKLYGDKIPTTPDEELKRFEKLFFPAFRS